MALSVERVRAKFRVFKHSLAKMETDMCYAIHERDEEIAKWKHKYEQERDKASRLQYPDTTGQ